jgi:hypothetical protein
MANTYQTIHDVAVALLTGRVLRGAELTGDPEATGAWGVIHCDQALGAFDARSDAWCGKDGIPHRFTREEAELRARRLSGSSHDGSAYSALEIPSKPRIIIAGRHCSATDGSLRFECVDWSTGPADVVAVGDAFDAAAAFVALLGERLSIAALYGEELRGAA